MISKLIGKRYIPTDNTTIRHPMSKKIKYLSSDDDICLAKTALQQTFCSKFEANVIFGLGSG